MTDCLVLALMGLLFAAGINLRPQPRTGWEVLPHEVAESAGIRASWAIIDTARIIGRAQ